MSASLSDVATLRQRVLDSLMKRSGDTPMPPTDDDIEEGEIQETVDESIRSKKKMFFPSVLQTAVETTTAQFPLGIPGLNGTRSNDSFTNSAPTKAVTSELAMPHDLPINFAPIHLNPALNESTTNVSFARPVVSHLGGHTPPWLPNSPLVNTKRPLSKDFAVSSRPQKRLGSQRHRSLVIDLESEDEDSREHVTSTSQASSNLAKTDERQASAAKLKQVEAEIAQAMAVINKAQQIQNARKADLSRSTTPTILAYQTLPVVATNAIAPSLSAMPKELPMAATAEVPAGNSDVAAEHSQLLAEMERLQAEISTLEATIFLDREALISSRIESAEVQRQRNIADIRRSDCRDAIQKFEDEIDRLQKELEQEQDSILHFEKETSELDRALSGSAALQDQLASQVKSNEEKRHQLRAMVRPLRRKLTENANPVLSDANVSFGHVEASSSLKLSSSMQPEISLSSTSQDSLLDPGRKSVKDFKNNIYSPSGATAISQRISEVNVPLAVTKRHSSQERYADANLSVRHLSIPSGSHKAADGAGEATSHNSSSALQARARRTDQAEADVPRKTNHMLVEQALKTFTTQKDYPPRSTELLKSDNSHLDKQRQDVPSAIVHSMPVNVTAMQAKARKDLSSDETKMASSHRAGTDKVDSVKKTVKASSYHTNGTILQDGPVADRLQEHITQSHYVSPLTKFKNFKYHIQYTQTVSSGFRSSTFFHKISQDIPLCKFESQGGICNAAGTCKDQHFAQLLMTDDEILIELSCATIGRTTKEKTSYRDGLRGVLQKMKTENIDDFNQVCARMIEYRRTKQEHANQSISSFF